MNQKAAVEEQEVSAKAKIAFEKEKEAFLAISPAIHTVLERNRIPDSSVSFVQTLTKQSQYSSIYFYGEGNLFLRMSFRGKICYFSVAQKYENLFPAEAIKKLASDEKNIRVVISEPEDILQYADPLSLALEDIINTLPDEFGCCSRYEQCSDAEKCINPNAEAGLHCAYRKNLMNHNIFYGKNRTK